MKSIAEIFRVIPHIVCPDSGNHYSVYSCGYLMTCSCGCGRNLSQMYKEQYGIHNMSNDDFARKFGGLTHHVTRNKLGMYRCSVYDFGPNVCAAGDGTTPEQAMANTHKVKFGYALRFDFLKHQLSEDRKTEIMEFFGVLMVNQLEMIADFVDAAR